MGDPGTVPKRELPPLPRHGLYAGSMRTTS